MKLDRITYHFAFEDGTSHSFEIPTRGWDESARAPEGDQPPDWTRLTVSRCSICPLNPEKHQYCPAAVDLSAAAKKFAAVASFTRANVKVVVGHRTYQATCDMNTGLRSLFGLYMALSGCPIAGRMRPLALRHVPFATVEETLTRVVSGYLLKQHFVLKTGGTPDWELKGLRELYETLELVSVAFVERLQRASKGDSNLNAMCGFASFARLYTMALDDMLTEEQADFLNGF